ncbi:MAG: PAS domain-containing sensor histidine kinase [Anaerolineales bacterium]
MLKFLRTGALIAGFAGILITLSLFDNPALIAGTVLLVVAGLLCWLGMDLALRDARRQKAHLAAVLENISDGVLTLDEQGNFVSANPALLKMIPEDRLREMNENPLEETIQWQRAVFSVRAAPVDEAGSVVIFHNETRRHETEQAKDALLATVSHELRTPLSVIMNYLELLLMLTEQGKMDTARFTKHLNHAIESCKRLLRLINAMLDQAQLQTGPAQIKKQAFNLPSLLNKTLDLMEARLTKKQLLFELKTARNVPAEMIGDPEQLRKVLVNLLDNAIKFTDRGGVLVRVSLPDKETLCIEVTDTGPGIPPEQLPDIFEPFRRGSDYVEREHQGAGLGLSIAKQRVTSMGGQISVASTLKVGSTFTICLPLESVTQR